MNDVIPKLAVSERRDKIRTLIEAVGIWNLSPTQLGKEWGVSHSQIRRDIKEVIKTIPPEDLEVVKLNLQSAFKKAISEMQKMLIGGNNNDKAKAAQTLATLAKAFTDILEAYGVKEKIADKIEHTGNLNATWIHLIKNIDHGPDDKRIIQHDIQRDIQEGDV